MKKILVGLLAIFAFVACQDKNTYIIKGTLSEKQDSLNVVLYGDPQGDVALDSTLVENGAFSLTGIADQGAKVAFIVINDNKVFPTYNKTMLVVLESGNINIDVADDKITVSGTPLNEAHSVLEANLKGQDRDGQFAAMRTFISENVKNVLGAFYFSMAYPIYDFEEIDEILAQIPAEIKEQDWMVKTQDQISKMKETSLIGKKFTDIEGFSIDGKKLKLSDFAGKDKIVLVDFWASWCGPCISELPNVVATYEKYKDKGFEIVGVSLDTDKKAWAETTKKHGITWPQFSNLKGWEDEAARAYNITGIPYTMMIDKDGTIVAENLRGGAVAEKLDELLQ